ncbi:MAG: hypothetical protein KBD76_04035 [Bacteriovorax sp.]|nr:hypothetical protein [Bacteriovorax sp.]
MTYVFMGLILNANVYAFDMSQVDLQNCEPIRRDDFVMKVIPQLPGFNVKVEFFIKGKSIGTDDVWYTPLKVGGVFRGNNLYYMNSFHRDESLVISTQENSCYTF